MKLKTLIFTLLIGSGLLSSCSDDANIIPQEENLNGTWNLKNLSEGFAGLNENYPDGAITWTFNAQNQTIIVDNNVPASEGFVFNSGTYNYSITTVNNQEYLNIDSGEFGGLSISTNNNLVIDQNVMSSGVGADGFILSFEK